MWCAGVKREGCGVLGRRGRGVVCWGEEGGVGCAMVKREGCDVLE